MTTLEDRVNNAEGWLSTIGILAFMAFWLAVVVGVATLVGLNHRVDKYRDVLCAEGVKLDDCQNASTLEERIQALEEELRKERAK